MDPGKYKILFTEKEIHGRVKELGSGISEDYAGKSLVLVGILKGAFVFLADLMRNFEKLDVEVDFLGILSYGDKTSPSSPPKITKDLSIDIRGRDVLVIEDIIDTGGTLEKLIVHIERKKPASLKICSLIDKRGRMKSDRSIDYVGFEIDRGFLIGYGLDFGEKFRHLKEIRIYEEDS